MRIITLRLIEIVRNNSNVLFDYTFWNSLFYTWFCIIPIYLFLQSNNSLMFSTRPLFIEM